MKKHRYVTTAIPYVNGAPHIGHGMDYLLADIWARYQRKNGEDVRFQIGTDEHGNKNAMKAAEQGLTPQQFADKMQPAFPALADKLEVSYTDVVRTTDGHHIGAVQYIWKQLEPHIYKGTYQGWYCTGCEQFYTDKEVETFGGVCPNHQKQFEQLSEENYYLRASDFTEEIRSAIESGKMKITPEFRRKEILELIKDGVKDVSISRPRKSLSWGVSVPGDPDQVVYVWIDALSNYITVLGYPDNEAWKEYWPADLQVVGKDIMRFHAIIWPAILLGIGLSLPKALLIHGFVNIGGAKISKSIGNVIDPNEVIDNYGVDAFRYYFSRHIPTQDDGDFTWERFEAAYNGELSNDLGNLVARVAAMVTRYEAGVIDVSRTGEHDMGPYRTAMEQLRFSDAIDEAWLLVRSLNQYIDQVKPWEIAKARDTDTEAAGHLTEVLAHSAATLLQIADMIEPHMPGTAARIREIFGNSLVPADVEPLFPRIYLHTPDPRTTKPQK